MLKLSGGERGEIRENPEQSASLYLFLSLTSAVTSPESQLSKTLRRKSMFGTTPLCQTLTPHIAENTTEIE